MSRLLRVLIVEDDTDDCELLLRELRRGGFDPAWKRVETAREFRESLEHESWEIILCDYKLPRFSAHEALQFLKDTARDIPCIVVSGTIGEETAVSLMKEGARDFIVKELTNRLNPAIERELKEAEVRRERNRAARALRDSEERYRGLFHNNHAVMLIIDPETGAIVDANPAACRYYGYAVSEIRRLNITDIHQHPRQEVFEAIQKAKGKKRSHFFFTHRLAGGEIRPVEVYSGPVHIDGKELVYSIVHDISERREAEKRLLESEARFRRLSQEFHALLDAIPDNLTLLSPRMEVLWANRRAGRLAGRDAADLMGEHCYTLWYQRSEPCAVCPVARSFESGAAEQGQIRTPDGRLWDVRTTPIKDEEGAVVSVVELARDITDQENMQIQLRQSQKMEALGTLAGGIAHDFNNILGIIVGYTEMARWQTTKGDAIWNNLEQVLIAADRAKDLVKQILAFSRHSEQKRRPVGAAEVAREAMKLLRASLPATIEIRTAVRTESMILADPTQIHQLFMNLCANSAYAMQENGGILEVTLEDVELAENEVPPFSGIRPGRHVKLTLSDTGPGIDPEILDRVFDPFFTTKPPGQGTGLGLAVVHGIVKSHDGAIQVESVPGKGTCFHIFFPAIKAPAEIEAPAAAVFPGGNERILLVDDEPALARAMKLMLERLGYRVACKTSGLEALEAFKNRAEEAQRVDLVITDMTMPQVTGTELARQIMALRPGLPVILCTGFSEKVSAEKVKDMGIRGFLMKPVTISDLAATVREALDDAKAGSEGRPREIPRRKSP